MARVCGQVCGLSGWRLQLALLVVCVVGGGWGGGRVGCTQQNVTQRGMGSPVGAGGPQKKGIHSRSKNDEKVGIAKSSATGTRTRVARVRAEYPNQLDYSGACRYNPLNRGRKSTILGVSGCSGKSQNAQLVEGGEPT
jgi:hypothetical protein